MLTTSTPNWHYIYLINTKLISINIDNFINNTFHFQITNGRQFLS